jgi:hypothetical protein
MEWSSGSFDPGRFDRAAVNRAVLILADRGR